MKQISPYTMLLLGVLSTNKEAVIMLVKLAKDASETINACQTGEEFSDLLTTKLKDNDLLWFRNLVTGLMLREIMEELDSILDEALPGSFDPEMN